MKQRILFVLYQIREMCIEFDHEYNGTTNGERLKDNSAIVKENDKMSKDLSCEI